MQKCRTQKANAGSLNKVPTNANIHLAVKNNEICSPLGELPKAFKKKRNRYSIFQKLLSETGITAVQLPKDYFTSGRHHFTYFWAYLGDLWPVFVPEQRNAFSSSLLLSKTPSEVQWLRQWDSQAWALEGVLRYLWVQTEKEQICNLNGTVSVPPWVEFLQSWCKIRRHTQSPARWQLRCLWPKEDKVQWQLQDSLPLSLEGHLWDINVPLHWTVDRDLSSLFLWTKRADYWGGPKQTLLLIPAFWN